MRNIGMLMIFTAGVFVGLVPENASGWIVLSVVLVAAVLYGVGAFIIEREVSQ